MRHIMLWCLLSLMCTVLPAGRSHAQYLLPNSVFSSAAVSAGNAQNGLHATLGQPLIGIAKETKHRIHAGFWFTRVAIPVGVDPLPENNERSLVLRQNYPNPFRNQTMVSFSTDQSIDALELSIHDVFGRLIVKLVDGMVPAGYHTAVFRPVVNGDMLPSGVYICRITSGNSIKQRSMLLIR